MKITILYLHVVASGYPEAAPPFYYLPFSKRFADTYRKFNPGIEHSVRIMCCGGEPTEAIRQLYAGITTEFDVYTGAGSDIGACQAGLKKINADFVVCMSTPVYFWRDGWLKRLVDAREFFGDGLYGPFASYQNAPHIRTSCWAVNPRTFDQYPTVIDSREKCCFAESFRGKKAWQISDWFSSIGKPAMLVTWTAVLARPEWRKVENIFRRGDQSNCLVRDQHVDVYEVSHYHERRVLERLADIDEGNPIVSPDS